MKWVTKFRVEWPTALVMVLLAYFDLTSSSMTVRRIEELGITPTVQVALLVTGAAFAIASRGRDWLFFVATMPFMAHLAIGVIIVLEARRSYHQAVIYTFCLVLLWLIYARQEASNE